MKLLKNADYDYVTNGITEENGYTKWYDWTTVRKHTRIIYMILMLMLVITAFAFRNLLRGTVGVRSFLKIILVGILFWLAVITPLHEILHLLPLSKGKLDSKCIITVGKGTASALYNGHTKYCDHLISLILPFSVFFVLLGAVTVLTKGTVSFFFLYLLILSSLGSYTDVYMFFYSMKHIGKNDVIFGLYKKEQKQLKN
ncbi:MAG: DUF3267 domain-containing protein [Clostridia bacterium]|nr:DUF3267 domain-containing protein [Clostridia bacterium]